MTEDVIAGVLAFHARQRDRGPAAPPAAGYRPESLRILFGEDAVVTAGTPTADRGPAAAGGDPAAAGQGAPVEPTGAQLLAAFPPRPIARVVAGDRGRPVGGAGHGCWRAPFALDNPVSQQTRRLGVLAVLSWLHDPAR